MRNTSLLTHTFTSTAALWYQLDGANARLFNNEVLHTITKVVTCAVFWIALVLSVIYWELRDLGKRIMNG